MMVDGLTQIRERRTFSPGLFCITETVREDKSERTKNEIVKLTTYTEYVTSRPNIMTSSFTLVSHLYSKPQKISCILYSVTLLKFYTQSVSWFGGTWILTV